MIDLGIRINLLLGPTVPLPAPPLVMESLEKAEVTHKDEGRSGFQLTFRSGRSGPEHLLEAPLIASMRLQPRMRAIITAQVGLRLHVISDGIIEKQDVKPGNKPGESTITVTGEDITSLMDRECKPEEHPAQPELVIAFKLIAKYAAYGLIPFVLPPLSLDVPLPMERIPVQTMSDLAYLKAMAARFGYVFYVEPGPVPATNTAYWGPKYRPGLPQPALTVNMGSSTNVESIDFSYEPGKAQRVVGTVQDRYTNAQMPVQTFISTRLPLSSQPVFLVDFMNLRTCPAEQAGGLNVMQAYARAQGNSDASTSRVLTATGTLDVVRYGTVLEPRRLVGLRGAGYQYDGLYYVEEVTHSIEHGKYTQNFRLTREGLGSITPVVLV